MTQNSWHQSLRAQTSRQGSNPAKQHHTCDVQRCPTPGLFANITGKQRQITSTTRAGKIPFVCSYNLLCMPYLVQINKLQAVWSADQLFPAQRAADRPASSRQPQERQSAASPGTVALQLLMQLHKRRSNPKSIAHHTPTPKPPAS